MILTLKAWGNWNFCTLGWAITITVPFPNHHPISECVQILVQVICLHTHKFTEATKALHWPWHALWRDDPNKTVPLKLPAFNRCQATTRLCRKAPGSEFHQWLRGIASYCWVLQTLYYCKSSTTPRRSTSSKWIYFWKMLEIPLITAFPDWYWKKPFPVKHPLTVWPGGWPACLCAFLLPPLQLTFALRISPLWCWIWHLSESLEKRAAFCFSSISVRQKVCWRKDSIITRRCFSQRARTYESGKYNSCFCWNCHKFIFLPAALMLILPIVAPFSPSNGHTYSSPPSPFPLSSGRPI